MSSTADAPAEPQVDQQRFVAAIAAAFPAARDIAPLRLPPQGWDNLTLETAAGLVFRFPRREPAAQAQGKEARLLPYLRGHLSAAVPMPEYAAEPTDDLPWGFQGYRKLGGRELRERDITDRTVEPLAGQIAQFLHELHGFSAERARTFDVPGPLAWREGFRALSRRVLPAIRSELRFSEHAQIRRWWRDFLDDDANWNFEPRLVHGDLIGPHLLVDLEVRKLVGVLDWGAAAVGDPAVDFAGLVASYGSDFTWRVVESYGARGAEVDATLLRRVRMLGAVAPFWAIEHALTAAQDAAPSGPSLRETIEAVRAGSILG